MFRVPLVSEKKKLMKKVGNDNNCKRIRAWYVKFVSVGRSHYLSCLTHIGGLKSELVVLLLAFLAQQLGLVHLYFVLGLITNWTSSYVIPAAIPANNGPP